jgi:hypothetical protein
MIAAVQTRAIFEGPKYREIAKRQIVDFPAKTPPEKWADYAAMLCLLNGLTRSASSEECFRPVTGVTGIPSLSSPTLDTVIADRVMDTHRLLPPYKLISGWRDAPITVRLACMHALVSLQPQGLFAPFTLRFREDVAARALKRNSGVCSRLHDRVYSNLRSIGTTHLWQAFECTDDGVVHSHGAFHLAGSASESVVKLALRRAGGEFPPESRARQVHFSPRDHEEPMGWATYARKNARASDVFFKGDAYASSQHLRRAAQELYESSRAYLNAQRRILFI